jgi:hypothetical protein
VHILSHFGTGFCVGAGIAAIGGRARFDVSLWMGLGAVLPDLDGLTVFFDHKVYYSRYWFSHHGALHSPVVAATAVLLSQLLVLPMRGLEGSSRWRVPVFVLIGWLIHLLEDLPCPAGPWGGLPLLWPISSQRFGGWTHIWWLNEYLIAVLGLGALLAGLGLAFARWGPNAWARAAFLGVIAWATSALFLAAHFVATSRYESPRQWESYQRRRMGDGLYSLVHKANSEVAPIWSKQIF